MSASNIRFQDDLQHTGGNILYTEYTCVRFPLKPLNQYPWLCNDNYYNSHPLQGKRAESSGGGDGQSSEDAVSAASLQQHESTLFGAVAGSGVGSNVHTLGRK
jgi:hypothetical protein